MILHKLFPIKFLIELPIEIEKGIKIYSVRVKLAM